MIIRSVVDFPDPFGPRNPVTVPGRTVNESRSTATAGPYLLVRSCTSIIDPCPPSGTRCVCLREITLGTGGPGRNPARPRLLVRGLSPVPGGDQSGRTRRLGRGRLLLLSLRPTRSIIAGDPGGGAARSRWQWMAMLVRSTCQISTPGRRSGQPSGELPAASSAMPCRSAVAELRQKGEASPTPAVSVAQSEHPPGEGTSISGALPNRALPQPLEDPRCAHAHLVHESSPGGVRGTG